MPTQTTRVLRIATLAVLALVVSLGTARATTQMIKVMTYNTHHGGQATTPATTDNQLDMIAAQKPDVVVLQEAYSSQLTYYVNGLNSRLGTDAWHGSYAKHCKSGTPPTCTSYKSETVMILTRLTTLAVDSTLIWAKDNYHVARATIRMSVALSDGTPVNVFVCHLPALSNAQAARMAYVSAFQTWAQSFSGPRLVGGDFNDSPGTAPIVAMTQEYGDAWVLRGSSSGYTHVRYPSLTPRSRIDYWFSDKNGLAIPASVSVVGDPADSDHLAVVGTYAIATNVPTGETTFLHDRFDTFSTTKWPGRVATGTQDSSIPIVVASGALRIGSLKEATPGTHYNGISSGSYDLSNNGYASVQLVKSPNTVTTAYAMFAVVRDSSNFYRWYQSGTALVAEKKITGTKTPLVNLPYDAVSHQFLRVRREYNPSTGLNDVVFETAPNIGGVPGTFVQRYREAWDTHILSTSLRFELKAGTSVPEIAPGSVYWDNFHAGDSHR
jgi:endonuclease/exonuclease/phosphatase family metal-dependent hydrolase